MLFVGKQYNLEKLGVMLTEKLKAALTSYPDFPSKGILFRDINSIFLNIDLFDELIEEMAKLPYISEADGIVAIDARGFIFGSILANKLKKRLVLARKKGKLPGDILEKSYDLEYGSDSLAIQKLALKNLKKVVIIDDLLATGGTAKCVADLLLSEEKEILSLIVVIELLSLKGRKKLPFPVHSQLQY